MSPCSCTAECGCIGAPVVPSCDNSAVPKVGCFFYFKLLHLSKRYTAQNIKYCLRNMKINSEKDTNVTVTIVLKYGFHSDSSQQRITRAKNLTQKSREVNLFRKFFLIFLES